MRSLTRSPGWVQRGFTLLLLLFLTTTSAGLLGLVNSRSAAAAPATQDQQPVRTVNLELILDLSGSMARDSGGGLNLRAASARELSNALFSVLEEIQVVVQNGFLEIEVSEAPLFLGFSGHGGMLGDGHDGRNGDGDRSGVEDHDRGQHGGDRPGDDDASH